MKNVADVRVGDLVIDYAGNLGVIVAIMTGAQVAKWDVMYSLFHETSRYAIVFCGSIPGHGVKINDSGLEIKHITSWDLKMVAR